jgi:putative signal transducing protein
MALITVYRAFNPAAAHVVRSRLEAAEFHPVIMHELSALSMDGYAMAAGGILVQVPENEAADAKELLESTPPSDDEPSG